LPSIEVARVSGWKLGGVHEDRDLVAGSVDAFAGKMRSSIEMARECPA
jgi:hypothetical protein